MKLIRKDFLKAVLVLVGGGLVVDRLTGCSDGSGGLGSGGVGSGGAGTGGSGSGGSGTGGSAGIGTGGRGTGGAAGGPGTGGRMGSGGASGGVGGASGGPGGAGGMGTGGASTGGAGGQGGAGTGGAGTGGAGGGPNACALHEPAETIGMNHPLGMEHVLVVPAVDVAAGVSKTYGIMGNSTHNHMVTLTADMFAMLRAGTAVQTVSTQFVSGGAFHVHTISVICA